MSAPGSHTGEPLRLGTRAVATAPVRVADVGGWTDTWFGSPGQVCSLAVGPGVRVEAEIVARPSGDRPVRLVAPGLGLDLRCGPSAEGGWRAPVPGDEPLLEHAVAAGIEGLDLPDAAGVVLTVTSPVPPGASVGTSASVVVAVLGALRGLAEAEAGDPGALARQAHQVETERAGREAGVQDHWAAAYGGCLRLVVGPYPDVRDHHIELAAPTAEGLRDRLVTVALGAHDSSAVHHEVINAITGCGGPDHDRARGALRKLAALAPQAAQALGDGDLERWAATLTAATEAQASLHRSLVGERHRAAIEVARSHGAAGWKVNGAGGDGGSLTVVAAHRPGAASELADALAAADPTWSILELRPAPGLDVQRSGT